MFKRIISIVLLATVLLMACAPAVAPAPERVVETVVVEVTPIPAEEGPEPVELLMWSESCAGMPPEDCAGWNDTYCDGTIKEPGDLGRKYVEEWHKLHPEYTHVNVKCIIATYGGGRIGQELTAMVRAGEGPNIYMLYGGRSWLAAEIGIDLDKYLSQEAKADYINYEQWLDEDGTVRVLPSHGTVQYPIANKQLIERACAQDGFDCAPPEPWSIVPYDEYLEIAEAIKALDDGSYIGILWGSMPSAQQLNWGYFAQAGIPASKDGGFTAFMGGEDVIAELLRLYDGGYLYPDVAGICDDDALALWGRAKIGIQMARLAWTDYFIGTAVSAGECEPWDPIPILGIQFREGVAPLATGGYFVTAGFIADNTLEEHREVAASFMAYVLTQPTGTPGALDALFTQHGQLERGLGSPGTQQELYAHIDKYGLGDDGVQYEMYNRVREAHAEMLTAVFLHKLTPEEGLAQFQAKVAELQGE